MPVALKGATSGQVTVDVPAVAGTNTLTLPAKTGNIITSADSGTVTGTMLAASTVAQSNLASGVVGSGPTFIAYQASNQSFSASTWTKISVDTKVYDTDTCYDNTNYWFLPTVAGYYQVNATAYMSGGSATYNALGIYKGSSSTLTLYLQGQQFAVSTSNNVGLGVAAIIYFNGSTDRIALYAYCTGTSPATLGGELYSNFSACLIRKA